MANPEDPKKPEQEYIPPRLRAKMFEEEEDEEAKKSKAMQNIVGIAMLVLVIGLGGALMVMMQRGKEEETRKKAAEAKRLAEEHFADSVRTHLEDSLRAARADSMAKLAPKLPPPTATAAAGAAGTPGAEAPPPEPTRYGIAVGTFMTQDRASQEQTKLQGSTGLAGSVSEVTQDNVTQYRVVIGDFTDRKEAEKKANELIVAASVREARVIKLPKN